MKRWDRRDIRQTSVNSRNAANYDGRDEYKRDSDGGDVGVRETPDLFHDVETMTLWDIFYDIETLV